MADTILPLEEYRPQVAPTRTRRLCLKMPEEGSRAFRKVLATLNMFPGGCSVSFKHTDGTWQHRAATCDPAQLLLTELAEQLGEENVVLQ